MQFARWLIIALLMAGIPRLASAADIDTPPSGKLIPGGANEIQHMYVFGPGGAARNGSQDNVQLVFFKVPATAGPFTLHVFDPASGSGLERGSSWFGTVTTSFTVYGGAGAYTDPKSQAVRPTADQPGTKLAGELYHTSNRDEWVTFGPFDPSQGEMVGGYAYFKLAAVGEDGSGANFFRLAVAPEQTDVFTHELTMHMVETVGKKMEFYVGIPEGVSTIKEHNFDFDTGGIPHFDGSKLASSRTGRWTSTEVDASAHAGKRVPYQVKKGTQGYANGGFYFTDAAGRPLRTYFEPGVEPPPPAPAPMPEPVGNSCVAQTKLVRMVKSIPPQGFLGNELAMTIEVMAKDNVADVKVTSSVPEGAQLVGTDPAAARAGDMLTWEFPTMDAGETKTLTVTIRPDREGELVSCGTITAIPRCCTQTFVGQPRLEITKTGPEQALINEQVAYTVTVTNVGTAVAQNVTLTDNVPAGLTHASGSRKLTQSLGDLAPNESREVQVLLTAADRGRHCNEATAVAGNATAVTDDACTTVVQRGLEVAKTGTATQYANKRASYEIVVTNTGDTSLTNVTVTDNAPMGTQILEAPGASVSGTTATWTIAELPAGGRKTFEMTLTSPMAGNLCNTVTVNTAEGLMESAEACTLWKGHPALLLEVIDTVDPLLPGEETEYVIRVTNQGTADDRQVGIVARWPAEISPVSAAGDTACTVDGKTVTMAPYAVLQPKQAIQWTVRAKAIQTGDSRLHVDLTSELLSRPVKEEESTHVY